MQVQAIFFSIRSKQNLVCLKNKKKHKTKKALELSRAFNYYLFKVIYSVDCSFFSGFGKRAFLESLNLPERLSISRIFISNS